MIKDLFGELQVVEVRGRDALTWRPFRGDTGECHEGHKHTIDHITMLITGDIEIVYPDRMEQYTAPASIPIDKDVEHKIMVKSNGTIWLCTFLIPDGGNAHALSLEA